MRAFADHQRQERARAEVGRAPGPAPPFAQRSARRADCACGGGCPRCQAEASSPRTALRVSEPGDAFEREADGVADSVMRMPLPARARGGETGEGATGAARHAAGPSPQAHDVPPAVGEVIRAPGTPLDATTRAFMESRFGRDFGHVRVHTDGAAAESAGSVSARAYTVGDHIVFGAGEYAPGGGDGRRLLAHELAHVVQQRAARPVPTLQRLPVTLPLPVMFKPPESTVEINAVDKRVDTTLPWYMPMRLMGPIVNVFRGDVTMTNVATMVDNVLAALRGRTMLRLNLIDHGDEEHIQIGDDIFVNENDVAPHAGKLALLRPHFAGGAILHVENCRAGHLRGVICKFAEAVGVPVYAGTGIHNTLLNFNLGSYVRCRPDGTFTPNVGRPKSPPPPRRIPPGGIA